jgi:quinoprotein glucose dehydrogenase
MRLLGYLSLAAAMLLAASLALPQSANKKEAIEWSAYGGNPEDSRYSPLKEINRSNVSKLQVAWTYDAGGSAAGGRGGGLESTPLEAGGLVFGNTPGGKVFAVDAATGKEAWSWDSKFPAGLKTRGFAYWTDGTERRLYAGINRYVYALDCKTGQPAAGFGDGGRIDLQQDLDRPPDQQSVSLTSPGVIYKDLLIVGGRVSETLPASYGDIRAYDVRTGKLRWTFHTIPRPGEPGYETWPKGAWEHTGSANNWAGMAVDVKRGIVFVPTGSAVSDFYGPDRLGDDLYANCVLALDAATGKRIWHFQAVKHDIWDKDFSAPPSLVTVKRDGKDVDAVVAINKPGLVFLFDRVTGKPLFPIEYKKVPPSTVDGEVAAATQPFPTKPAPIASQVLTADMLTNRTPEVHQWALDKFKTFISGEPDTPLSVGKDTVVTPGFYGGAEWGGMAYDPQSHLLFVNANEMPCYTSLVAAPLPANGHDLYTTNCSSCHGADMSGNAGSAPSLKGISSHMTEAQVTAMVQQGGGRMPGFPALRGPALRALVQYVVTGASQATAAAAASPYDLKYRFSGYNKFLDPDGYPAIAPPWGTLNAINLNTGEYAWKIPLGEYPELVAKGMKDTGSENYGGPAVTAGGLVFIAATVADRKIRAFDKDTGKLLWEAVMPSAAMGAPAIYEAGGREYIVLAAAGGKSREGGNAAVYVAYALPK